MRSYRLKGAEPEMQRTCKAMPEVYGSVWAVHLRRLKRYAEAGLP